MLEALKRFSFYLRVKLGRLVIVVKLEPGVAVKQQQAAEGTEPA